MANYSVTKNYGHFTQIFYVEAESEADAWNRAEKDGKLQYQLVYREPKDTKSKGHVVDLDKKSREDPPIQDEQYYQWMREAINKGMIVSPKEYEKTLGLPFHDVW